MKSLKQKSTGSKVPNISRIVASILVPGVVFAGLGSPPAFASITSPSPVDTSNAIRWDPDNSPIGDIVFEFIDRDDTTKNIDAPFPINFYGTRFPAICLSTNGLIYPIAQVSSGCSSAHDVNLENLSLESRASAIAALALDLDLSEGIHNPQRESPEELEVASLTVSDFTITATTKSPHGFNVGEYVYFDENEDYITHGIRSSSLNGSRILTVPTPTTFTVPNHDIDWSDGTFTPIPGGTYTPIAGNRAVVFREVIFARVDELQLSGTTLTVKTNRDHDFGVGGKFTFNGTGVSGLDGAKFVVASRVDDDKFTVTVPASMLDVDSSQVGDQASRAFVSPRPWALERDEVGAIQQVYFGQTTVEGRDAYSLTWYRTATNDTSRSATNGINFPLANPETGSITVQLLIIKRSTGSDAAGWDFDYEVNIGHATDAFDGYSSDNPTYGCSTSDQSKCRWGIGTANFVSGSSISSISRDGTVLTINTVAPHNLISGQRFIYEVVTSSQTLGPKTRSVLAVVDSDTITVSDTNSAFSDEPAQSGQLFYSVASELFPSNSVLELRDAGGSTALVRNSLNSNVLGRYTFGMVNGAITAFLAPTMGQGVSGTPPAAPAPVTSTSPVPVLAATGVHMEDLLSAAIWVTILGGLMTLFSRVRLKEE